VEGNTALVHTLARSIFVASLVALVASLLHKLLYLPKPTAAQGSWGGTRNAWMSFTVVTNTHTARTGQGTLCNKASGGMLFRRFPVYTLRKKLSSVALDRTFVLTAVKHIILWWNKWTSFGAWNTG